MAAREHAKVTLTRASWRRALINPQSSTGLRSSSPIWSKGTFSSYGREPRAALIEDRSLKEVQPGVYTTTVQLGDEGVYDVELLLAGASAVQIGTATFRDPRAPGRILRELQGWCRKHRVRRLADLIGAVQT